VRFLGYRSDAITLLHASDAFLFTSDGGGEGYPYTLLEASACNLPIILNASSGVYSAVSDAGATMASDDARQLAEAAINAIEQRSSRPREWALSHDFAGWIATHSEIMRSVV
jgi:glycosyltransferase involved in cell wall biosynthesis